ncbi:hypothetical protein LWI29_012122 [Acer saccharum]|uniref:Peptidase C19 ubiquitin carboxyl-terminal hydrolase domain-containing protein n=1 Tax=Acer saccharum TaxID=4024 RepID=A0AA39S7A3_ACESA|nr:hypothetical protein LWI29_012122 [Acer saccharum]
MSSSSMSNNKKSERENFFRRMILEDVWEYQKNFKDQLKLAESGLITQPVDRFLYVIMQSLWMLREFIDEMTRGSRKHNKHIGNPCVVCALYELFAVMEKTRVVYPLTNGGEIVAAAFTSFRIAFTTWLPNFNIQLEEHIVNAASEVLQAIFRALHDSFNYDHAELDCKYKSDSDNCSKNGCFAHKIFGMHHYKKIKCIKCSVESRRKKYTSFFLTADASHLRMMKIMHNHPQYSFDSLLRLVMTHELLACDEHEGGCGVLNPIYHTLNNLPYALTIVLGWQKNNVESSKDISETLSALSNELDLGVLFPAVKPGIFAYLLMSMIIGEWDDVVNVCREMSLQPLVMFFYRKFKL